MGQKRFSACVLSTHGTNTLDMSYSSQYKRNIYHFSNFLNTKNLLKKSLQKKLLPLFYKTAICYINTTFNLPVHKNSLKRYLALKLENLCNSEKNHASYF